MKIYFVTNILPAEELSPGCNVLMSFYDFEVQKMESCFTRFRAFREERKRRADALYADYLARLAAARGSSISHNWHESQ